MVDSVTSSQPVIGTASSGTTSATTTLTSDFNTFLKMLTVQAENQDPLNPVDSTEFASQLAQFSAVEQQVRTNDLLTGISESLNGSALQEVGKWIGMEGLVRAPVLFAGQSISIRPEYHADADSAQLVVRDSGGTEIQRFDLDIEEENVVWGGADAEGNPLPYGIYSFSVESYEGDKQIKSERAQVYSVIEEVRTGTNGVTVTFADGTEMAHELITGLRAPS
jgi:flagellar basal-body rod modification protein FlgD